VLNQCVGVFTTTYFPGGKYSLSKSLRFIHKYVRHKLNSSRTKIKIMKNKKNTKKKSEFIQIGCFRTFLKYFSVILININSKNIKL